MQEFQDTQATAARAEALQKAHARLLELETLTTGLLTCPEEQLDELLSRRDALMDELGTLMGPEPRPIELPPGSDASPEAEAVREAAGQCRAVACRLAQLDQQAVARLQNMQQRVLQKIRTVGRSAGAHAARYYTPASPYSSFTGSV